MKSDNPSFFFVLRVLTGLVGICIPVMLARFMSVGDFANYATISAASGIALLFSSLGIDRACLRYLPAFVGKASAGTLSNFLLILSVPRMLAIGLAIGVMLWSGFWLPHNHLESDPDRTQAMILLSALSVAMAASEVTAGIIQGVLIHHTYALIVFVVTVARAMSLVYFAWVGEQIDYKIALWVVIVTELGSFLIQGLAIGWAAIKWGGKTQETFTAPSLRDVMVSSSANYWTYIVGLPWSAPALILLVGNCCNPETTAVYAFFANLAERARQFLPVQMLQSYVEPTWAKQYQSSGRIKCFKIPLVMLAKSNLVLLSLGLVLMITCGGPMLELLTQPVYADYVLLLLLIIIQVSIGTISALLWIGLNATEETTQLARTYTIVSLTMSPFLIPLGYLGGAVAIILWTWLPPLLLLGLLRRDKVPFALLALRLHQMAVLLLSGIFAGMVGRMISDNREMQLGNTFLSLAVCLTLWSSLVWWSASPNRAEKMILKNFILGKRRRN